MNNEDKTIVAGRPYRVAPGTRLNDIYQIDSLIGVGGMSEIYKGHNIHNQDEVAIKVILPEFAQDEQMVTLFRREALTLNRLNHETIVRYNLFSKDAKENLLYLAMEYVNGPTLRDSMRQRPLSQQEACVLVMKVAAGMAAAHAEGVVHRDLSTDNIILTDNDVSRPKVIDFGIARSATTNDSTLISSGFAGKYGYVSPEQLGLFGGHITEATDIYSLGLVFAATLLGRPLDMAGSHADVVMKRQSVPDLSMINPGVKPIIEKMLQPNPALRLQNMQAVADALRPLVSVTRKETVRKSRGNRPRTVQPSEPIARRVPKRSGAAPLFWLTLALGGAAIWFGATQTEYGRKLTQSVLSRIAELVGEPKNAETTAAPKVDPVTGKTEIKAGDPPAASGESATVSGGEPSKQTDVATTPPPEPPAETAAPADTVANGSSAAPNEIDAVDDLNAKEETTATATAEPDKTIGQTPSENAQNSVAPETPVVSENGTQQETQAATEPASSPETVSVEAPAATENTTTAEQTPVAVAEQPRTEEPAKAPETVAQTDTTPAIEPASTQPKAALDANTPPGWVANFEGGTCFHAIGGNPVQGGVTIEGFGNSVEPFKKLDADFSRKFNQEPEIRLRLVPDAHCGIVDFVRATSGSPLSIRVETDLLKSTSSLSANLMGLGREYAAVFVVTPDGLMVNVTFLSKRYDDELVLELPADAFVSTAGDSYLLFAIASDKLIPLLDESRFSDISAFIRQLTEQAGGAPIDTALKFIRKQS